MDGVGGGGHIYITVPQVSSFVRINGHNKQKAFAVKDIYFVFNGILLRTWLKGNGLKKEPVGILPTQDLYIKETLLLVSKSNEDTIRHDPWPIAINLQGNSSLPEKLVTQYR